MNIGSTTIPETLREGRYTLGRVLGQGGMAVVTTAHDNELGVDRAVKLLLASGRHRLSLRRRLKAEARAMARLHHPNILSIHDVGIEGELDYVVMDLAVGGSLHDRIAESGPLRPSLAIQYVIQALSALAAAHAAGIVHRDVKPHNILLDAQDRAMLADFGIALLTGDDRRTKSGVAMGSLAFMPPEQRLDAAKVGPGADIYACGSTLFNLVTGENPVDLFLASERSPRWTNVPEPMQEVLRRACRMEPEERWATAGDMAYALLEVLRADTDGFSTAEGPFGPTFPEPSVGFSKHTTASGPASTLVPPAVSAATAHAVEALESVAPAPTGGAVEHQPTLTSHEATPTTEPGRSADSDATWAPTQGVPVSELPAVTEGRSRYAAGGAVAILLLFCLGWVILFSTAQEPSPQTGPIEGDVSVPVPAEAPAIHESHAPESPAAPAVVEPPVPATTPSPTTTPAPSPAAVPSPTLSPHPPSLPASPVAGRWDGTMGGAFVELQLEGSDASIRGIMSTSIGSRVSKQPVRGSFIPDQGMLVLAETDARPPARFELSLDGDRLNGSVIKSTGGRGPIALGRR